MKNSILILIAISALSFGDVKLRSGQVVIPDTSRTDVNTMQPGKAVITITPGVRYFTDSNHITVQWITSAAHRYTVSDTAELRGLNAALVKKALEGK